MRTFIGTNRINYQVYLAITSPRSHYSNNDTVTINRPAVLNDAYYLEDEDVSDEEDVPVENRDQIQKIIKILNVHRNEEDFSQCFFKG